MSLITISILKIILVVVIIGAMTLILLGISHLFSGSFNSDEYEAAKMRKDLLDKEDVVTRRGIFGQLLFPDNKHRK